MKKNFINNFDKLYYQMFRLFCKNKINCIINNLVTSIRRYYWEYGFRIVKRYVLLSYMKMKKQYTKDFKLTIGVYY